MKIAGTNRDIMKTPSDFSYNKVSGGAGKTYVP